MGWLPTVMSMVDIRHLTSSELHRRPIAAKHVIDPHRSASNAMSHGPGSSCDSRRTPSNHTRTCNKLPDLYM
jgi:hypothetical protein